MTGDVGRHESTGEIETGYVCIGDRDGATRRIETVKNADRLDCVLARGQIDKFIVAVAAIRNQRVHWTSQPNLPNERCGINRNPS